MSELEPTRTYSNPTANDILRRMLDEAGVEWHDDGYATTCTVWTANGITWHGLWRDGSIELLAHHLTPEQAIAATFGSCNRSSNCTNSERTETCEADETDLIPFVRADSDDFEVDYIHVMECTECGHVYEHVNGDYEFCPRCGRKREDVSE